MSGVNVDSNFQENNPVDPNQSSQISPILSQVVTENLSLQELQERLTTLQSITVSSLHPEEQALLKTALLSVQSAMVMQALCIDADKDLGKVDKIIRETERIVSSMENPKEAKRERGRRFMDPLVILSELKDAILLQDPREVYKYPKLREALRRIEQAFDLLQPITLEQINAVQGLHLEGNTPVGFFHHSESRCRTFSYPCDLGVAEKVKTVAIPRFAEDYKKTLSTVFSHEMYVPSDSSLYKPLRDASVAPPASIRLADVIYKGPVVGTINEGTCSEMKEKIEAPVRRFFTNTPYNSFPSLVDFIDFFTASAEFRTPLEAYKRFDPGPERIRECGDCCTGQTFAILDVLRKDFQVQGYPIVVKEEGAALPNHTAAVIPCQDGVLFLEILSPENPLTIIKREQSTTISENGNEVELALTATKKGYLRLDLTSSETPAPGSVIRKKKFYMLADLPTKAVMLKYMADRVEFPLVRDGCDYGIIVNVHEGTITFKIGEGRSADRKSYAFREFPSEEVGHLLTEFCSELKAPLEQVRGQLEKIIEHQSILKELATQIRVPVPTHEKKQIES